MHRRRKNQYAKDVLEGELFINNNNLTPSETSHVLHNEAFPSGREEDSEFAQLLEEAEIEPPYRNEKGEVETPYHNTAQYKMITTSDTINTQGS